MTHKDILEYKIKLRDWWYSVHDDGFDISENKRYSLESIFLEALKAAEARGREEALKEAVSAIEGSKYVFERDKSDYLPEVYKHLKSKNEGKDDAITAVEGLSKET